MEEEVKFLDIDPEAIQKKLAEIGAHKIGEYFYRRRVFDYPDFRLDKQNAWLRLRDEGDRIMLTFKQRQEVSNHDGSTNDTGMKEIEVQVNDFERTTELLLSIGLIEKHLVENRRIRSVKDDTEFNIDTYPALEPYLEIEALSWGKIDKAILELGLNPIDKKIFSTNQVYAMKGIQVIDHIRLTFDGLIKRNEK